MSTKNTNSLAASSRSRSHSRSRKPNPPPSSASGDLFTLRDHYARLSSEWVTRQLLIHVEDQPRQDILQALVDAGRVPDLTTAAHTLRRHAPHLQLTFQEESK